MLKVEKFINELMSSNCYIVWDDEALRCIVIDPASEKSTREIDFIDGHKAQVDYILMTHEHTDHTWGVNSLLQKYSSAKVLCSKACKDNLLFVGDIYFQLYYERMNYHSEVARVDLTVEELGDKLEWLDNIICFIDTPGHSMGSICIEIDGILFTGDTIMQTKPYINKRNGSKELYKKSVQMVLSMFNDDCLVYPGHGEVFYLKELIQ